MTTLRLTATGPRPAEEVWERYARPDLWTTWAPQIRRVDLDAERLAAGVTGRVHGPLGVAADVSVDTWDEEARQWSWTVRPRAASLPVVRGARLRLRLEHGVRSTGEGSLTWLRLSGPAPLVWPYAPVARLALHRLVH